MTNRDDDDDAIERERAAIESASKCRPDCNCTEVASEMEDALNSDSYEFARDTLESIYEYFERTNHMTLAQIGAVKNILAKGTLTTRER